MFLHLRTIELAWYGDLYTKLNNMLMSGFPGVWPFQRGSPGWQAA